MGVICVSYLFYFEVTKSVGSRVPNKQGCVSDRVGLTILELR